MSMPREDTSGDPISNDRLKGNWEQLKGKIKETWGRLTNDDLTEIAGQRDQLLGKIRERYQIALEEAEEQVRKWERTIRS
jgi:uncharacterized protein YjbJ (UPF0337 family)